MPGFLTCRVEWIRVKKSYPEGERALHLFCYLVLVGTESAFTPMNKCLFKRICTDITLLLSKSRGTFYILWTHRHCGNLKLQLRKEGKISPPPQPGANTFSVSQPPSLSLKFESDLTRDVALEEGRAVGLGEPGAFSFEREIHLHNPQEKGWPKADLSWGCLREERLE